MAEFAPGMRVLIRDEEWMIRKCDPNSFNTYTLQCVGVSPLVRDKTAYFLSDLERDYETAWEYFSKRQG